MDSERPAEPGSPAAHCVVWHAPGVPPPADLMAALEKRHVSIVFCTGPFAALAEVCALDRGAHGGATGGHGVVLVVVRASALVDAGAVVRAVEMYAPRARCWRYEATAAVRLSAVASPELESTPELMDAKPEAVVVMPPFRGGAMPPAPGAVRHAAQGRVQLRLAGDGILPARPEEVDSPDPARGASEPPTPAAEGGRTQQGPVREPAGEGGASEPAKGRLRQVLSQDELAMLLDEDMDGFKRKPAPPPRRAGDST